MVNGDISLSLLRNFFWSMDHLHQCEPNFYVAEVYAVLACAHETETQDQPEKYVSICSDSQAALKAFQAAKTTSPLV